MSTTSNDQIDSGAGGAFKARLRSDLTLAIKARDELRTATIRMVLSAITNEEVSGSTARALTDAEVEKVLAREAKKRREAAEAFSGAGRAELADRERAEGGVIDEYLPAQLSDDELRELVSTAIAEAGASGPQAMGSVMKIATPLVAGRAEGGRIAGEVKRQLTS
jgi:uncharacterized protein YqeY